MSAAIDRRLRAVREEGVVRMAGSATNTSNTDLILQHLVNEDEQVYDLAALMPSTWVGLRSLYSTFTEGSQRVTLRNLPEETYRHLSLIDAEEQRLQFVGARVLRVEAGKLAEVALEAEADAAGPNPEHFVLGTLPANGPGREDSSSEAFCVSYTAFVANTVDLSGGIIFSLELELLELLKRINARVSVYDQALGQIHDAHESSREQLEGFRSQMDELFEPIKGKSVELRNELFEDLAEIQRAFLAQEGPAVHAGWQKLPQAVESLQAIGSLMETTGTAVGQAIASFDFVAKIRRSLTAVAGLNLEGDELEECRDEFEIMDPEGEDSWSETLELLGREVDELETIVGESMVTLQGFDLARQVLEHRIDELEAIQAQGEAPDMESLTRQLHEKMSAKLATDQETLAYGAFFPQAKEEYAIEDKAPPGEMLLF